MIVVCQYYKKSIDQMTQTVNIKIVIVGDGSVGKTCVMIRYTQNYFNTEYVPTIFDNKVKSIKMQGMNINLNLWDTAGQQAYSTLRTVAYPNTDIFLITFSATDKNTFINAKKRWYPEVKTAVPSARVIFVGTKADLRYSIPYGSEQNNMLSRQQIQKNIQNELSSQYKECSSLSGEGIQDLFNEAVRIVLRNQGYIKESIKTSTSKSKSTHQKSKTIEQGIQDEGYCSTCQLI